MARALIVFNVVGAVAGIVSSVFLYGVFREVRLILHALNGGCLP